MKWVNQSLFRRLLISYLFIFVLGFSLIGIVIATSSQNYITEAKRQELLQQANNINGAILDYYEVNSELEDILAQLGQFSGYNIWLISNKGEIVATASKKMFLSTTHSVTILLKTF